MNKTPLYQEIAETIRREIVYGTLQPGDELPTVREMAEKWQCAPGTIMRAYKELAAQGLVDSRPGAGTQVASNAIPAMQTPLRKARLINQVEGHLLNMMAAGYVPQEIEQAFQLALDRYRAIADESALPEGKTLRFAGSHDPAMSLLAGQVPITLSYTGSLGGLFALARHEADLAGIHLWDKETDSYNRPFIQRLFPGQRMALLNLANRHIGLMVQAGNPLAISGLSDLIRPGVRFINRQQGAGTRVWLDAHLHPMDIAPEQIQGYENEALTHSEVASTIHDNQADVGLGIETVAITYGLPFIHLTTERYDLVIPENIWEHPVILAAVKLLQSKDFQLAIDQLGGYDTTRTGTSEWLM